ncbi:MAG: hypothetical protein NVSMB29_07470 [Candidatus Dormibacteria bacterium]
MHPRGLSPGTRAAAREVAACSAAGPVRTAAGEQLPAESLASVQRRSGLSDAELARIFKVHVGALAGWCRHGVPRADAHRLQLLSEVLDALHSCGDTPPLAPALRRPLPQPGTPSLVDLLARRDTGGITAYLLARNPELPLTGRGALRV